ncbi:hypothetical protein [Vibrio parahaemolyticus]|uniref:Uncharacterized protein n=1 Tax=Vibrio parahaemolyticus TaxID=670 RepID=A0AA46UJI9_VIBPH|nr:hypothetical protein [Vibrio parahaemolyticus]UYV26832.1 hypothetical protein M5598_02205 [Vibrio parahaemolyticus]
MKTLNITYQDAPYKITIHEDTLKVELNNIVLVERLHSYSLIKDSKIHLNQDALISINVKYIYIVMQAAAVKLFTDRPVSFDINESEFEIMRDFLLADDDKEDVVNSLSDFAIKHNLVSKDNSFDLKKINLLFDDMSQSSIYRAVHDKTYKTSSALLKKIELMDFILDNMSNTKYHQILEL